MTILAHKTVLLTGAAGGIGRVIAKALVAAQAKVVCVGRSPASLQALQTELIEIGGEAIALPFDLQNLAAMPNLIAEIERKIGPVDILINNAAIETFRPFEAYELSEIQAMATTNLLAPMALCRLLLPKMIARGGGHIVNISSGAGKRGAPFNSVYSATKAGLNNWSEALRLELAESPVQVSVLCPGITDAGMFHALETDAPEGMKVTPPEVVASKVLQMIEHDLPEVLLDGFTNKVFVALSQFSPELGDKILHRVGVVATNRECAERMIAKKQQLPIHQPAL